MSKKVLLIAGESPYKPAHGGKIDIYHRFSLLKKMGADIFLVHWNDDNNTYSQYLEYFIPDPKNTIILKRNLSFTNVFHPIYPHRILNYFPDKKDIEELMQRVQSFKPKYIILDNWYGFLLARYIRERINIPLFYRSHNIEHLYYAQQMKNANWNIKIKIFLNWVKLYFFEEKLRRYCDLVLDISEEDMNYWISKKHQNTLLLPPTLDYTFIGTDKVSKGDIDLLYVGNLWAPNNLNGLKWFIEEVLPIIKSIKGEISIVFAGANPSQNLIKQCLENNIEVLPNPTNVYELYESAKVLLNPTFFGSGVGIKMIEMLSTGKRIVSTSIGCKGLPLEIRKYVDIADNSNAFSQAIINNIKNYKNENNDAKLFVRNYFGLESLRKVMDRLYSYSSEKGEI